MEGFLNVYFAGELFSTKHLIGNAVLAEAIWELSEGRYHCFLPQNLEKRHSSPQSIRDEDLKSVISADVGLFNYDGPELDSGTVVEYLFAKFADIPSVILRTDFRGGGDQGTHHAWNLMTSFFPRTEVLVINSMALYKEALEFHANEASSTCLQGAKFSSSSRYIIQMVAKQVIAAMDRVTQTEPIMPEEMRETIYRWLAIFPGFKEQHPDLTANLLKTLERKMKL
jgi:nucleoside 2-deoxyribosyltransferase